MPCLTHRDVGFDLWVKRGLCGVMSLSKASKHRRRLLGNAASTAACKEARLAGLTAGASHLA
jgi:hypothetical protein